MQRGLGSLEKRVIALLHVCNTIISWLTWFGTIYTLLQNFCFHNHKWPQIGDNSQTKFICIFWSANVCWTWLAWHCTGKFTRLGRRSVVWASLKPLKRGLYRTQQRMYQNGYKTKNVANIQIYWLVFELLKLIKGFTYKKALKSADVRKVQSFCVLLKILW